MPQIDLIPHDEPKKCPPEQAEIDAAAVLDLIAEINDLQLALENGTETGLLGWLRDAAAEERAIPAVKLIPSVKKIYELVATFQTRLIGVWKPNRKSPEGPARPE